MECSSCRVIFDLAQSFPWRPPLPQLLITAPAASQCAAGRAAESFFCISSHSQLSGLPPLLDHRAVPQPNLTSAAIQGTFGKRRLGSFFLLDFNSPTLAFQ